MHSTRGLIAFARFYVLALDWDYAVTSPNYSAHYGQRGCQECARTHKFIVGIARKHEHFSGGRLTLLRSALIRYPDFPRSNNTVSVVFDVGRFAIITATGKRISKEQPLHAIHFDITSQWVDGAWRVTEWGARESKH